MAYVYSRIISQNAANESTFSPSISEHAPGDYILIMGLNSIGGTAITVSAGWTIEIQGASAQGNQRSFAIWKKAITSNETVQISGSTGRWDTCCMTIRDANDTTFIEASNLSVITTIRNAPSAPLTTTTNDCLLVYSWGLQGGANSRAFVEPSNLVHRCRVADAANELLLVGTRPQLTSGSAPSVVATNALTGHAITLAIRNAPSGSRCQFPSNGITTFESFYQVVPFAALSTVFTAPISGIPISTVAPTVSSQPSNKLDWGYVTELRSTESTTGAWVGGVYTLSAAVDLSQNPFSIHTGTAGGFVSTLMGTEGFLIALIDTNGNWKAWQVEKGIDVRSAESYTYFLDANSTPYASSGTLNTSSINRIASLTHRIGSSTTAQSTRISRFIRMEPGLLAGGGTNNYLFTGLLANSIGAWNTVDTISLQSNGQLLYRQTIQLGDGGTSPTYIDNLAQSSELPLPFNYDQGRRFWNITEEQSNINILAGPNDYISLSSSIFSSGQRHFFNIDPSSSTSATYNFTGLAIVGYRVQWKTGIPCNSVNFAKCYELDFKSALIRSCSVSLSANTGGSASKIDDGGIIRNTDFTKGDETYAVRLPTAGTYDLQDCTFTGYTTVLNIEATTGTVNVIISASQPQPTYVTAGATVVFQKPLTTVTINNIVIGSRLLMRRTDTLEVLINEIVSTTSRAYTYEYNADRPVEIVLRKASTAPFYQEWRTTATLSSSSFSINANQLTDE